MQIKTIKILFLLILSALFGHGQQQAKKTTNKLSPIATLIRNGQLEEALLLNIKIVEEAKKKKDNHTITLAYIEISNILCIFGEHLESLKYLDLANKLVSKTDNERLKVRIYSNYGRNYSALKIDNKSLNYFNKGIATCKTLKTGQSRALANLYTNKASAFLNTKHKLDSALIYLHKAVKTKETPFRYAVLSNYYSKEYINIDSARYYLNKSKLTPAQETSAYHKSIIYQAQANLYKLTGKYKEAITYYHKSLEISERMKKYIEVKLTYKLLSETYDLLNQQNKAHEFLLKYTTFNDSINQTYKKNVDTVISTFLKEEEALHNSTKKKFNLLIITGLLLFILSIAIIIFYYRKKRTRLITEKEKLIKQKTIESNRLKQKLNLAFDDVILLAKNNDSSFLIRFQEVYPHVCKKLLEINPKLVNTELTLCAMIWLNFSSKDIAQYTHVQPKTVQTKKYRLRKKLELPEATNLYLWIKNL